MLADRICVMRAGRILQLGEPADIYYRPADPFVAGFIGETNLIPITVTGRSGEHVAYRSEEIADAQGSIPASMVAEDVGPGPALMMVRPELIRRCAEGEKADCSLPATITEVFTKGGTVQYRARTPKGFDLAIEIQGTSAPSHAAGRERAARLAEEGHLGPEAGRGLTSWNPKSPEAGATPNSGSRRCPASCCRPPASSRRW